MRGALEVVLGLVQLGTWAMLATVSAQLLRASFWAFRAGKIAEKDPLPASGSVPFVTVQLPIRNERGRADELLRTIARLDWPRERFEVQVLDDSDDDTKSIVDETVESLRTEGVDIVAIRRSVPYGYKAGALAEGLKTARGEYVAIFDADARPSPDCLARLVAAIESDSRHAYVQARWSFENAGAGLLQRTQAMILDALFAGEQARLSALGLPVQFNGTAGLWRRAALSTAGGWLGSDGTKASVTEDLALSFRVGLAEQFGATKPEIVVETELPETVAAFRQQQARWVRGSGEVLRALVSSIATGTAGSRARATMLGHLLRHARQPLLFGFVLLWPATLWATPRFRIDWVWTLLVAATCATMGLYFAAVRRRLGRSWLPAFFFSPVVMALSIGLCPVLTRAFLGGAFGERAAFERTPKGGGYRARPRGFFELGLGLVYLVVAGRAVTTGSILEGATVAWFFCFGLIWVGSAAFGR